MLDQNSNKIKSIPDKRYFTIGEVGELCDLEAHVLRYWEQEFSSLNPMKRSGNRRYYIREDIMIVRRIQDLLHNQGFTIEGARKQFAKGANNTATGGGYKKEVLNGLLGDLENVLSELETEV